MYNLQNRYFVSNTYWYTPIVNAYSRYGNGLPDHDFFHICGIEFQPSETRDEKRLRPSE